MIEPVDVLIVDDDDFVTQVVSAQLRQNGYSTARAIDGVEALRMLATESLPRLVVLDVRMPLVNGFGVLTQIRAREETRLLPVLMMTSQSQKQDVLRAMSDGASDYLAKPFRPSELMVRVRRLLGEAEPGGPAGA